MKGIKNLKNKEELSLWEYNRKNVLVNTNYKQSISYEKSKKYNYKNKKGTTKLLISKTKQPSPNSTKKIYWILNKNQKKN